MTSLGSIDRWYWTDGNDVETNNVYVHYDGNDMEWINPKWWCNDQLTYGTGNAFRLLISQPSYRVSGCWCDGEITEIQHFICEANI